MPQIADSRWRHPRVDLPVDYQGPIDVAFEEFDDA